MLPGRYHSMSERRAIERCPLCTASSREAWLHALGFELVRCSICGHRYASEVLGSEVLAHDYYDEPDAALVARAMVGKAKRFEEYLALLGPRLPRGGRVLDVGCNSGELLSLFQARGFVPFGIERSPGPARFAERQLGVAIWRGSAEDVLPPDARFELVTLCHVLEHIPEPSALLARLATSLAAGGRLLIEVPNADDALLEVWAGGYRPLCPGDHVSFFDAAHLQRSLEQAGLVVEALVSPTHARDVFYPSLLSAVDRVRLGLRRAAAEPLAGVCAQTRYRGRWRQPLRAALDLVVEALDPVALRATRGWQRELRGAVLIAVARPAHQSPGS